jgi:thimet oligopeptidase
MARFFKLLLLPMTPSFTRLSVVATAAWLASCAQPAVQATPPLVPVAASTALTASPDDFLARCRAELVAAHDRMNRLKASPAGGTAALDAYDEAQRLLRDVDSRAGIAAELHPDKPMREAGEKCGQEADGISTGFSLDRGIYDALARIAPSTQDAATRHYLEKTLRDFRLAGVDRDEATRARVRALNDELTRLSQEFGKNIRESVLTVEATPAELEGLPADFIKAHPPGANGKVVLKTDNPDYFPVMSYSRSTALRERFYKAYSNRAYPKNLDTLGKILTARQELARLLGYANWADYIMANKMIGDGGHAAEFIEKISTAAGPRAKRDYEDMLVRKRKDDAAATDVKPWETSYLVERIRVEQFNVDSQEVRPYFQYEKVKQGVLDTTARLFGIRFDRVADAKVWHPDVETYDVYDTGNRRLGRIYLDMFPRENKYKHYAHATLLHGKAGVALPESVLLCNFRKPTASDPGLLEYGDVRTFFHEFGHLVHAIVGGQGRWAGIAGVATERDFVEAPSQMLEEWIRDPKVLQSFATHYQTAQPIPTELAKRLVKAGEINRGLGVRSQMLLAAMSLEYHRRDPRTLDTTAVMHELQRKYTPYQPVPENHFQAAFGHLDGYSAVYYTYMWSLVIAKDMFSEFAANGDIMDSGVASRYRKAVLEPGGAKPAADLVKDFLGRPYSFKAYEAWLNSAN